MAGLDESRVTRGQSQTRGQRQTRSPQLDREASQPISPGRADTDAAANAVRAMDSRHLSGIDMKAMRDRVRANAATDGGVLGSIGRGVNVVGAILQGINGNPVPMKQIVEEQQANRGKQLIAYSMGVRYINNAFMQIDSLGEGANREHVLENMLTGVRNKHGEASADVVMNMMRNRDVSGLFREPGTTLVSLMNEYPASDLAVGIKNSWANGKNHEDFTQTTEGNKAFKQVYGMKYGLQAQDKARTVVTQLRKEAEAGNPKAAEILKDGIHIEEFLGINDLKNENGESMFSEKQKLGADEMQYLVEGGFLHSQLGFKILGLKELVETEKQKSISQEKAAAEIGTEMGKADIEIAKKAELAKTPGTTPWNNIQEENRKLASDHPNPALKKDIAGIKTAADAQFVLDTWGPNGEGELSSELIQRLQAMAGLPVSSAEHYMDLVRKGERKTVRTDDAPQWFAEGWTKDFSRTARGTASEVMGSTVLETKGQRGKAVQAAGAAASTRARATHLLDRLSDMGSGVVGASAVIGEKGSEISSLLDLFMDAAPLEKSFVKWITQSPENPDGATPEQLSNFMAWSQAFIASAVPLATGEKSGRITKEELQIATRTFKLRDPLATAAQVRGALTSAIQMSYVEQDLQRMLLGETPVHNLETKEGTQGWVQGVVREMQGVLDNNELGQLLTVVKQQRAAILRAGTTAAPSGSFVDVKRGAALYQRQLDENKTASSQEDQILDDNEDFLLNATGAPASRTRPDSSTVRVLGLPIGSVTPN